MQINVKVDADRVTRRLKGIQRRQIPYATSVALNKTAQKVVKAEQVQMRKKLDRPTPQTIKAVRMRPSNKRYLRATVFLLDWAADYLKYQIHGGTRPVRNTAVPTRNARLNKFGNIPGRRTGLIKRKNQFMNEDGVFKRVRGEAVLEYAFVDNPKYKPRWPFYRIGFNVVRNVFPREMNRALAQALRTAR